MTKTLVAKRLIRLDPFKLSFAAKSMFGSDTSNALTKMANRLKGKVDMTEDEAEKVIEAYRELTKNIDEILDTL